MSNTRGCFVKSGGPQLNLTNHTDALLSPHLGGVNNGVNSASLCWRGTLCQLPSHILASFTVDVQRRISDCNLDVPRRPAGGGAHWLCAPPGLLGGGGGSTQFMRPPPPGRQGREGGL